MTDPIYVPLSLYERLFGKLQSNSNSTADCGKCSLIIRPIRTYPKGHIVVGVETECRKAVGEDETAMLLRASDLKQLPFYENGDLLAEHPDFELVRTEIQLDQSLRKAILNGSSAGRYIASLIRDNGGTKDEIIESAALKFTNPDGNIGYGDLKKREQWLKKSQIAIRGSWKQSWKPGVQNCLRHYIAEELAPKSRRGNGKASDSSTYPRDEYTKVWNSLAQMCPDLSVTQLIRLKTLYQQSSAARKLLDSLELPSTLVPQYLGDLHAEKKEKLSKERFDLAKEKGRRASPPLPCYYTQKANKLKSGELTGVRKFLEHTLVGDVIDAPEHVAAQMMVVCFDHFMHGKQITKRRSRDLFDYVPRSREEIVKQLPNSNQLAPEDVQIVNEILACDLVRTSEIDDPADRNAASAYSNSSTSIVDDLDHREQLELCLRRAQVNQFEDFVFRDMHDLPIPPRLQAFSGVFEALPDQEKVAIRESVEKKVWNAPARNRQLER